MVTNFYGENRRRLAQAVMAYRAEFVSELASPLAPDANLYGLKQNRKIQEQAMVFHIVEVVL